MTTETYQRHAHYTDCGQDADTKKRLEAQYEAIGAQSDVNFVDGGPLAIAFTATTKLESRADEINAAARAWLKTNNLSLAPVALNAAPRNSSEKKDAAAEDPIYLIETDEKNPDYVVYGKEIVAWIQVFLGKSIKTISAVNSIPDAQISDTHNGTQFRSATYLPIAQAAHALGKLKGSSADIQPITDPRYFPQINLPQNGGIILPPDGKNFSNSRILVSSEVFDAVLSQGKNAINGLPLHFDEFDQQLNEKLLKGINASDSLTNVGQDNLGLWPSSNHLPSPDVKVLNLGKQWQEGQNKQTDPEAIRIAELFQKNIGAVLSFESVN